LNLLTFLLLMKGWNSRADTIRELLLAEGIKLIDKPKGETLVIREVYD
jgi:cysteinyl-tRNA synthetase